MLFRRYYESLCAFAETRVGSADAEEIVEDLFATIWAKRAGWIIRRGVKEYLYAAVRNGVTKQRRHDRVKDRLAERRGAADRVPGHGSGPAPADQQLYVGELQSAVSKAIAELPERCRTSFVLRCRDQKSYAAIAAQMKLSTRTVENHIGRALKALRRALGEFL
jgi:RNA polymerase sigma-70 factor (ECF subfamily)